MGADTDWRSRQILRRPEWSNVRSLFKSMGYSDEDLSRPRPRTCRISTQPEAFRRS